MEDRVMLHVRFLVELTSSSNLVVYNSILMISYSND
jgi:hypothetical protein